MTPLLAMALVQVSRPTLSLPADSSKAFHVQAFEKALDNLLVTNTVLFDPGKFDQSGLLGGRPGQFVRAGGGYDEPWTRDSSINSWNAASLLEPEVAKNTLYAVLSKDEAGRPIVQPDNQWWDKVIWIIGAWNHYKTTGDREFLQVSYGVAQRVLARMKPERFDAEYGLYRGGSVFNDGISGYPTPPGPSDDRGSSFVLDHEGTDRLMALSTNCVYVGAMKATAEMANELRRPGKEATSYRTSARALSQAINQRLWLPDAGRYAYLQHGAPPVRGKVDPSQEGTGESFAILFGVADQHRAASILKTMHIEPFGVVDVYPHFERYSDSKPGRHNMTIWPMVEGMWARAATQLRSSRELARASDNIAKLALAHEGNFYEIYDSKSGAIEGGWQSAHRWDSQPHQTWSATAYLSTVINGVFGFRFEPKGLHFEPLVPDGWSGALLRKIQYRRMTLDVLISGTGRRLKRIRLDQKPFKGLIPPSLTGHHSVELTVD